MTALAARLAEWSGRLHAVIDGARFDNVGATLAAAGLGSRPLFLEHSGSVVTSGPFLARVDERGLSHLLRIPDASAACVFWGGAIEEPALFRHLRGLNLADIPRPPGPPDDPFAAVRETVLFRHWDPSVLAITLPVMDPAQRARLLGPTEAIILDASGAPLVARRREDWPEPVRGRLRFSAAQMAAITDAMTAGSRRAITSYLRGSAPAQTAGMDNPALHDLIARSEAEGRALGLTRERALGQFAYLWLISGGRIAGIPQARAFLMSGPGRADDRMDQLMLGMAGELLRRGAPL